MATHLETELLTSVLVGLFALVCLVWEKLAPAVPLPHARSWYWRLLAVVVMTSVTGRLGRVLGEPLAAVDLPTKVLAPLPPWAQGLVGFLVLSFVHYWWHLVRHRSRLLWNVFHQLHHSPSRIEVFTAYFVHPLETLGSSLLNALFFFGLGGSIEGSFFFVGLFFLFGIFSHANVRTPAWLDLFVGTPELHRIHHIEGKHWGNFSGFPIIDRLFGTYIPRQVPEPAVAKGFRDELEQRFLDILLLRNVLDRHPKRPVLPGKTG